MSPHDYKTLWSQLHPAKPPGKDIVTALILQPSPDFYYREDDKEKQILDNLSEFFQGKTVVIVAHQLSTVQNADNIIVLEKGKVI